MSHSHPYPPAGVSGPRPHASLAIAVSGGPTNSTAVATKSSVGSPGLMPIRLSSEPHYHPPHITGSNAYKPAEPQFHLPSSKYFKHTSQRPNGGSLSDRSSKPATVAITGSTAAEIQAYLAFYKTIVKNGTAAGRAVPLAGGLRQPLPNTSRHHVPTSQPNELSLFHTQQRALPYSHHDTAFNASLQKSLQQPKVSKKSHSQQQQLLHRMLWQDSLRLNEEEEEQKLQSGQQQHQFHQHQQQQLFFPQQPPSQYLHVAPSSLHSSSTTGFSTPSQQPMGGSGYASHHMTPSSSTSSLHRTSQYHSPQPKQFFTSPMNLAGLSMPGSMVIGPSDPTSLYQLTPIPPSQSELQSAQTTPLSKSLSPKTPSNGPLLTPMMISVTTPTSSSSSSQQQPQKNLTIVTTSPSSKMQIDTTMTTTTTPTVTSSTPPATTAVTTPTPIASPPPNSKSLEDSSSTQPQPSPQPKKSPRPSPASSPLSSSTTPAASPTTGAQSAAFLAYKQAKLAAREEKEREKERVEMERKKKANEDLAKRMRIEQERNESKRLSEMEAMRLAKLEAKNKQAKEKELLEKRRQELYEFHVAAKTGASVEKVDSATGGDVMSNVDPLVRSCKKGDVSSFQSHLLQTWREIYREQLRIEEADAKDAARLELERKQRLAAEIKVTLEAAARRAAIAAGKDMATWDLEPEEKKAIAQRAADMANGTFTQTTATTTATKTAAPSTTVSSSTSSTSATSSDDLNPSQAPDGHNVIVVVGSEGHQRSTSTTSNTGLTSDSTAATTSTRPKSAASSIHGSDSDSSSSSSDDEDGGSDHESVTPLRTMKTFTNTRSSLQRAHTQTNLTDDFGVKKTVKTKTSSKKKSPKPVPPSVAENEDQKENAPPVRSTSNTGNSNPATTVPLPATLSLSSTIVRGKHSRRPSASGGASSQGNSREEKSMKEIMDKLGNTTSSTATTTTTPTPKSHHHHHHHHNTKLPKSEVAKQFQDVLETVKRTQLAVAAANSKTTSKSTSGSSTPALAPAAITSTSSTPAVAATASQSELESLKRMSIFLDRKDTNGSTILMHAIWRKQVALVPILLAMGAPLNTQDSFQNTPLHLSCLRGLESCMFELLSRGARIDIPNSKGKLPFELPANIELKEVVRIATTFQRIARQFLKSPSNTDSSSTASTGFYTDDDLEFLNNYVNRKTLQLLEAENDRKRSEAAAAQAAAQARAQQEAEAAETIKTSARVRGALRRASAEAAAINALQNGGSGGSPSLSRRTSMDPAGVIPSSGSKRSSLADVVSQLTAAGSSGSKRASMERVTSIPSAVTANTSTTAATTDGVTAATTTTTELDSPRRRQMLGFSRRTSNGPSPPKTKSIPSASSSATSNPDTEPSTASTSPSAKKRKTLTSKRTSAATETTSAANTIEASTNPPAAATPAPYSIPLDALSF